MAQAFKFAVVRLAPQDARDERLNVGAVVFSDSGLDIRLGRRLEKVRAISGALDQDTLVDLIGGFALLDEAARKRSEIGWEERAAQLARVGPVSLSSLGTFIANGAAEYEARIASILTSLVDAEPASPRTKRKHSRLLTQLKTEFRRERVLAARNEDLASHRIVAGYELDEGLVADLVLKNGAMHVVETVDASDEDVSIRRAVADIAVSALVLERAKMRFGERKTKPTLVYNASSSLERLARPSLEAAEHQGVALTNWASADERRRLVHLLTSLATPALKKNRGRAIRFAGGGGPLL